jgi:hypothetical protein
MAVESSKGTSQDQVESLVDELMRDIFKDSGVFSESSARGMANSAALFEQAFGPGRAGSRASVLERILIAEAFAAELAETLAPALAEQLAPRLVKALEQLTVGDAAARKPTSAGGSASQARRQNGK